MPASSSRRLDIALAMLLILAVVSLMLPPLLPVAWIANTVLVACAAAKARLVVLDFLGLDPCPQLHHLALHQAHHRGGGDPKIWSTQKIENERIGTAQLPASLIPKSLARQLNGLLEQIGYQGEFQAD